VTIRLTGADDDVREAAALIEETLGELLHLSAPEPSTRPEYRGTWRVYGTLQIVRGVRRPGQRRRRP
jgi:hypothetical protein